MTADIDHTLDEPRCIRAMLENALREGIPASDVRMAIAMATMSGECRERPRCVRNAGGGGFIRPSLPA